MRAARGFTFLELLVYLLLMGFALHVIAMLSLAFRETGERVGRALDDLEVAARLLRDLKQDLRRARSMEASPSRLRLGFDAGAADYEFRAAEGSVLRSGDGPPREYVGAFDRVLFDHRGDSLALVEVELRRHEAAASFRPRCQATVYLRSREP